MAFKMKGFSAYDKMEPSGYKKMGSAYDKHGAYKQTDGEKKDIQIEEKPEIKIEKSDTSPGKINNINEIVKSLGHNYDTIYNMFTDGPDGEGDWGEHFDDYDILNYAKKNKK
jgi:hypothetical protein